jgi:predicted transcriptional regulator
MPFNVKVHHRKGMRNRSKLDTISLILQAANGDDITKTQIMYKTFVSHTQLKEFLTDLTESGLLRYDFVRHTFKTTEKGLSFLETYSQMDQMIKVPQI